MLIQQSLRTARALLLEEAFGPGAAEPRPIGFSLPGGPIAFEALLMPFEIDEIAQRRPLQWTAG